MEPKTIVAIVLVAFIIGGFIHLRSKLAASRADRQYRLSAWGLRLKRRSVLYHLV